MTGDTGGPAAGYAGRVLRVDLSEKRISAEDEAPAALRKYVGGMGLGARVLYDEVPPGTAWSDPENRVILASGPLAGTRVMGSGTFCAVTKGALTDGATSTQANGFLGAYLKFAGFDAVIVHGKAAHLSYLYIHDGTAELRDARHLAGRDTWETEDLVKAELGFSRPAMSVFSIGPAGENLVRFAALVGDRGHVAAHNGLGAVLGAKNLKAIAVARGQGKVRVHDAAKLAAHSQAMFEIIRDGPGWWSSIYRWGTLWLMARNVAIGRAPLKNYTTSVSPMTAEQLKTFAPEFLRQSFTGAKPHPCWACRMHHCHVIRVPEGPYAGMEGEEPEYEGYAAVGTQVGIWDGTAVTALCNEVDRLGLNVIETGWVLGMVIDCYEKGLLTGRDTDGLQMTWGNVAAVRAMIQKIARREGMGDILAEGVMRAAQRLGGDAPRSAIHSMGGNTPRAHDHRVFWPYILDICTSNTGTSEANVTVQPAFLGLREPGQYSHREIASLVGRVKGSSTFLDCLGVCRFTNQEVPEHLVEMLNAATGWDFTWDEAMRAGLRAVNLLRAFNIRHGYDPRTEAPSPRYGSTPLDGPAAGTGIMPLWDEMVDIYYREMGWDRPSGKPLPETLRRLDLPDLVPVLWSEGD